MRNVPEGEQVTAYHCEKKCNLATDKSSLNDVRNSWMNTCINVSNKDKNIYTYCEFTFENDNFLKHNCRLDSCRLCCSIYDKSFKNADSSLSTQKDCYQACADKFKMLK